MTHRLSSSGSLRATPDPVEEGKAVTVIYTDGGSSSYQIDFGPVESLTVDENNRATIRAPVGAASICIFDDMGSEICVEVVSQSGRWR